MLVLAMQFSRDTLSSRRRSAGTHLAQNARTPGHEDRVSECRGPPWMPHGQCHGLRVLRPCSLKTKERT